METPLTSREVARKASRELIKQQNDTTGGGKVRYINYSELKNLRFWF